MDFMLIQSYLDRLPDIDKLVKNSDILKLSDKYGADIVKARLVEILEDQYKLITTAKFEKEVENLDTKSKYYAEIIKEEFKANEEITRHNILNCMGSIFSKELGETIYSKNILKDFTEIFQDYNNFSYDVRNNRYIDIHEELVDLLKQYNDKKSYLVVNNLASATSLIFNNYYKDKNVAASLKDNICLMDGLGISDIIKESSNSFNQVGYYNKVTIDDYKNECDENSVIINSYFLENDFSEFIGLSDKDNELLNKECDMVYLSNRVYLETSNSEIKTLGKDLDWVIDSNFKFAAVDISNLSGFPKAGIIIGDDDDIEKIKMSLNYKMSKLSRETLVIYYLMLNSWIVEKKRETFLNKAFKKGNTALHKKNARVIASLSEAIGDKAEIAVIDANTLRITPEATNNTMLEREIISIKPLQKSVNEVEEFLRMATPSVLCWLQGEELLFNLQLISSKDEKILEDLIIEAL